jgi:hypothetical protein
LAAQVRSDSARPLIGTTARSADPRVEVLRK